MSELASVVVVGASLAGLRAAEELRAQGFKGRVTMVGDELVTPYDRPPLSKQLLAGTWSVDQVALPVAAPGGLDALHLDWRRGVRAVGLELDERAVVLDKGEPVEFDGLVVATGASPVPLPGSHGLAGVHMLRTLDDCLALRAGLEAGPDRVVVVGGGFIGAEVAATCRGRGIDVTLVEALPVPLERVLGAEIGAAMADIHRDHGVDVRLGVGVAGLEGNGRVQEVHLADGTTVAADLVVVGIGVRPNAGWLAGSGLLLDDGVVCDETGLAAPGVVAAGDVARWWSRRFDELVRIEHWDNAITMGVHAARRLLAGKDGTDMAYDPVPWFWSDQYDRKVQVVGRSVDADEVRVVEGSLAERRFVAVYRRRNRLVAALAMNRPSRLVAYRRLIEGGASWRDALDLGR